jgi:hypothetical protein
MADVKRLAPTFKTEKPEKRLSWEKSARILNLLILVIFVAQFKQCIKEYTNIILWLLIFLQSNII